jgi:hypothetical protein
MASLCCLLAGCGSMDIERYAVAEGKPVAMLHIDYIDQTRSNPPVQIFVMKNVPDPQCRLRVSDLSLLTALGGSGNAMNDYKPARSRDVRIVAGEPIVLSLGASAFVASGRVSCGFRVGFQPEAGAEYLMTYEQRAENCGIGLMQRSAGGPWVRVPWSDPYPQCIRKSDSILKAFEPTPRFPTR